MLVQISRVTKEFLFFTNFRHMIQKIRPCFHIKKKTNFLPGTLYGKQFKYGSISSKFSRFIYYLFPTFGLKMLIAILSLIKIYLKRFFYVAGRVMVKIPRAALVSAATVLGPKLLFISNDQIKTYIGWEILRRHRDRHVGIS